MHRRCLRGTRDCKIGMAEFRDYLKIASRFTRLLLKKRNYQRTDSYAIANHTSAMAVKKIE